MDPLALAAVVGLVFAGKRLADSSDEQSTVHQAKAKSATTKPITRKDLDMMSNSRDHAKDYFDLKVMTPNLGRRIGDWRIQPKNEVRSLQTLDPLATRSPFGQPVYDLYNRENVTNKMNNVPPVERMNVGPGLGIGPDVPSAGGFHDYFRAMPVNINEERLTTLKGLPGPPSAFVKNGGAGGIGEITHQAKETKSWNRPPAQNRGEGQGGALTGPEKRPEFQRTKRTTIRQETGMRQDTLDVGPGQYNVYQPYAVGTSNYTDKSLTRVSDNRSKEDRAGNAGRMNVREDPVNQVGSATHVRSETTPFPIAHGDAGRYQQYKDAEFYKFNEFKANRNPMAEPAYLDIAIQQLEKNEVAVTPLAVS